MAGQAAYRYDYAEAAPRYSRPDITPVPSRGFVEQLDPRWFVLARVAVAIALIFAVAAFTRVYFTNTAVAASIEYEQVSADLNAARAQGSVLEVQAANLSNPAYVRDYASQHLGMSAPATVETMTMGEDVVAVDADGALSLSQSLAAVARG